MSEDDSSSDCSPLKSSRDCVSNRIQVDELKAYLRNKSNCKAIFQEFDSLRCGYYTYKEVARSEENLMKNRYDTLVAYDHNRVVLSPASGDSTSDYINASYIDGYNKPRKFIAAQGPLPTTINDFWHMVWQENTKRIAMVTGIVEGRLAKCAKYWPEKDKSYADIEVKVTSTKSFPQYDIRTFQVTKGQSSREVVHFYFKDWLDQEVPDDPVALASFVRAFKAMETKDEGPTIVHCSAGVARTGVVIMLDNMIEMAKVEKAVDLFAHLYAMRKQRYNAIAAAEQYFFTYQMLAEHLLPVNEPKTQEQGRIL